MGRRRGPALPRAGLLGRRLRPRARRGPARLPRPRRRPGDGAAGGPRRGRGAVGHWAARAAVQRALRPEPRCRRGDPRRRRYRRRAARTVAAAPLRRRFPDPRPPRLPGPRALGRPGPLSLLGDEDRQRGRPPGPPRLRHRPALGPARGRRRRNRRRLLLRPAGDARGGARDVRRAGGPGRARDGGSDGVRVRRVLRLRGACSPSGGYMRLCVDGPVVRGDEIGTALIPGSGGH